MRFRRSPIAVLFIAVLAAACGRGAAVPVADERGGVMPAGTERLADDQSPFLRQFEAGQRETLLYVWTRSATAGGNDLIAVVDVDPASQSYGRIVGTAPVGSGGNEAHHFGYTANADRIFAGGMFSNRMYRFDVASDPRELRLSRTIDLAATGYGGPHTAYAVPGGLLVTMMGGEGGTGAIVELDDNGDVVRTIPAPMHNGRPVNLYDITVRPQTNRMLTTGLAHHSHLEHGPPSPEQVGNQVVVWDWSKREVTQIAEIDAGPAVLRPLRRAGATGGFVNALFGNSIWYWDEDGAGALRFERVVQLPDGSLPADMRITPDDRYLLVSLWAGGRVQQYDISDPRSPRLVGEAELPQPNMMKLSPDGRRLYVTNSLLTSLDGDVRFGAWLFEVGENGLSRDARFAPDFEGLTGGRGGPHDMLLR
jgi:methanethiol oxidase